jgi:hypothetical protein
MQQVHEDFTRDQREYDAAHGFTPIINRCSRVEDIKTRGRDLNAKIKRDNISRSRNAASYVSAIDKPKYSTSIKNLRAAAAVAKELPALSGEALLQHQSHLNDLLSEANVHQEAYKKVNPSAGASQYVVPAHDTGAKSKG